MHFKIIVIRTDFEHHGENSGYKQILKYIKPYRVFGINERDKLKKEIKLKKKHQWLFEFEAYLKRGSADLIHIFYGEDYFRWSTRLFKNIPIVVTFHQPPELLKLELSMGNFRGRVARIMHLLNKNRFKKISAAIVTSESQRDVLADYMPKKKIHVIPLGVNIESLNKKYDNYIVSSRGNRPIDKYILTVGNWLRDWDFYFKVAEYCKDKIFYLVNQRLDSKYEEMLINYPNIKYFKNIDDDGMFNLFLGATVHFVPITGLAASNALIQGFALGCPLVLTDVQADEFKENEGIVSLYEKDNINDCISKIDYFYKLPQETLLLYKEKAHLLAQQFSWEEVARKTNELYSQVIKEN